MIPIVVGSRSPRRLELLKAALPQAELTVCPPADSDELGFSDVETLAGFERRILEIAAAKLDDVTAQCLGPSTELAEAIGGSFAVICADTTVIVTDESGRSVALGQPPELFDWRAVVADWFRRHLAGRTHVVMSAVVVARCQCSDGSRTVRSRVCSTRVTMRDDIDAWLEWYLSTEESVGKAGGYAIQGAGSVFVTKLEGSYSNVVGLPLEEMLDCLRELEVLESA